MYPTTNSKADDDRLFGVLASSGIFSEFFRHVEAVQCHEQGKAEKLAMDALIDATLVGAAQRQLGRASMMKDFAEFLASYKK